MSQENYKREILQRFLTDKELRKFDHLYEQNKIKNLFWKRYRKKETRRV